MPFEMTPEQEAKFFETGELPPEATATAEQSAATPETPPAAATTTPAAAPATPTAPSPYDALQRQLIEAEARRAATEQQLADLVAQLQGMQQATTEAAP